MFNRKIRGRILLIILFLIFSSCQSTNENASQQVRIITIEEALDAISLLYNDTLDQGKRNVAITLDDIEPLFSSNLNAYREKLNRFEVLYQNSLRELSLLLEEAAKEAIEALRDLEYNTSDPISMLSTPSLISTNRPLIAEALSSSISEYVEQNRTLFDSTYNELKLECDILVLNEENLEILGYRTTLSEIGDFNMEMAILLATEIACNTLSECENTLRSTPLSLQKDNRYELFWEAL